MPPRDPRKCTRTCLFVCVSLEQCDNLFFLFFRSAFFIFCSEFRPKVKSEHPGLSIGEVAKKLGELWNNTNSEDKQPYEKKASKLKEKYEKVRAPSVSAALALEVVARL